MRISKRLKAITGFISDNSKIIDIGCDHALLDIYIYQNFKNVSVIASDIHEGAIKIAKNNIKRYNLEDKINLRYGDGLSVVNKNEIDTIIISGMGYNNIKKILSDTDKLESVEKIIVQSNTDIVKLRKMVISLGYKIEREVMVKEKEIIYTIIEFTKGKEKYTYEQMYFGPRILENKDDLFYEYYNKKLLKYENLLLQLPQSGIYAKIHHSRLIKMIKKQLEYQNINK